MRSSSALVHPRPFDMPHSSHPDAVRKAAAWLLLGVAGGLVLDLCAKEILRSYSLLEFAFLRNLVSLILFFLLAPRWLGGYWNLRTTRWKWHALRGVLAIGTIFGFFYGLARMPLVNALTLGFTEPLIVTALSVLFLGEHVGWRRWAAVFVGFLGIVVMLRPGHGEFTFASAAVLFGAFCYACQASPAIDTRTAGIFSIDRRHAGRLSDLERSSGRVGTNRRHNYRRIGFVRVLS